MDFFERLQHVFIQYHIEAVDVDFQLIHRGGAQQGAGDERLLTHEGQRHLRRIQPVFFGQRHVLGDRQLGLLP